MRARRADGREGDSKTIATTGERVRLSSWRLLHRKNVRGRFPCLSTRDKRHLPRTRT